MSTYEGVTFLGKPTRVEAGTSNGARNKPNEDRFMVFTGPGNSGQPAQFLVLADGVTSTHGGERASDIAVRRLQQILGTPQTSGRPPKGLRERMIDAINIANQEILDTARRDPELRGMSTTLVMAAVEGDQLTLTNLGDSRAYLIRNRKAFQLTRDHTWVQEALDEGRITPEQARTHPNKHVIQRYLGDPRGLSIDISVRDPEKPAGNPDETEIGRQQTRSNDTALTLRLGDALLLCSDGLYNRVTEAEIGTAVSSNSADKAVKWLIDRAVKLDEPDNITIVLWATGGTPAAGAVAAPGARRNALALAVAGVALVVLALMAFWLFGSQPGEPAVAEVTPAAGEVAVAAPPATGEQAVGAATPAAAAEVAAAMETATSVPADTPVPTTAATEMAPGVATETPTTVLSIEEPPTVTAPTGGEILPQVIAQSTVPTDTAILGPTSTALPATPLSSDSTEQPTAFPVAAGGSDVTATLNSVAATETTTIPMLVTAQTDVQPTSKASAMPSKPTSTPLPPSPTALPTNTPTTTPTRRPVVTAVATTSTPNSNQSASGSQGPTSVENLGPEDGANSANPIKFSWTPNRPLAPGQAFEVKFWKKTGLEGDRRAWVNAGTDASITVIPENQAADNYFWAVYLVNKNPYSEILRLSEPRVFTVSSTGGGSESDGGSSGGGQGGNERP